MPTLFLLYVPSVSVKECRYNFLPDTQKTILVLRADPDAEITKIPQMIRIMVRPLIDGHLMKPLLAAELPLMVVTSRSKTIANK